MISQRKKPIWRRDRNRDLILEAYANELEGSNLNASVIVISQRRNTRHWNMHLSYDDIVIKRADKGSRVVLMDRERYIREGRRQLSDRGVYVELEEDTMGDMIDRVNKWV